MNYQIDTDKTVRYYRHSERLSSEGKFWLSSDDMLLELSETVSDVIVSFSRGKDSIAAAYQCLRFFKNVEFVYMYNVPNLQFCEPSLQFYEKVFGKKILRLPEPSLYNRLNNFCYQPTNRCNYIEDMNLPYFKSNENAFDQLFEAARIHLGLNESCLIADGVRACDNPNRWSAISQYGGYLKRRKKIHACYDWTESDCYDLIKNNGWKLPIDYKVWGRTFDGIDYKFIKGLKEYFPNDFEQLLLFFPSLEMEILKYDNY